MTLNSLTFRSTRTAYGSRLALPLGPLKKTSLFPGSCLFKRHSPSQAFLGQVFCRSPGFACKRCAKLRSFWPLALIQQAQTAIVSKAQYPAVTALSFMHCSRRVACTSPFQPSGLTFRSTGPAYGGPVSLPVRCLHGKGPHRATVARSRSSTFAAGCL
jgi:hypothetical protein